MSGVAFEILLILALIVANGVFAFSEIAVVSARKARLQQLAESGDRGAAAALELANSPQNFLATVQVGITLVGILTGAFGGATVARALGDWARAVPALAPYASTLALATVVAATTYLSLLIGELVPKRLALSNPERAAIRMARPMQWLSRAAAPLVWLLGASSTALSRLLGMRESTEPPVTEEELKVILQQGTEAGVFETTEQQMVESVFRLTDRRVSSIATPRTEVDWLDLADGPDEIARRIGERRHAYYAVCEGSPDRVAGVVEAKDLLAHCLAGEPFDLRASLRPALFVPENIRVVRLLELFRQHRTHIAVVVEELGGTFGLVTLVDVMEAIVGEVPLAGDEESEIVERADGSWLVDGRFAVVDLQDRLDSPPLHAGGAGTVDRVGGLVANHLGRIPAAGDAFELAGFRFEVMDMDGLRVDKVLVSRL
jgi:putative hemolysin